MLKYNNTHIFTGYLKQLLSSFNLPTCKIYTREFARYLEANGQEDPRIIKSFDKLDNESKLSKTVRVGYLKNDELFNYYQVLDSSDQVIVPVSWQRIPNVSYSPESSVKGLTRTLVSPGTTYDATTHKYLGEYLRFVRDYYNINLMSLYNCFSEELCNNININKTIQPAEEVRNGSSGANIELIVNSSNSNYKIYKIPVKLFADYTIAIENYGSIEMFCGLYNRVLDNSARSGQKLIEKTYKKVTGTLFSQPFLYDKLNVRFWQDNALCCDIAAREQDLYLFIKVPAVNKSSIVILEGDYREYNSSSYTAHLGVDSSKTIWEYSQNKAILNFSTDLDLNKYKFKPISRLQLLAFNTGESYPFADRLIEYLIGSAITSMDDIHDNIARAQRVMSQNKNFFNIEGLWENKMQNLLYDYMTNSGEIKVGTDDKLKDSREGYHRQLGHTSKSMLFDILGYVDRDTEKTYASYTKKVDKQGKLTAQVENTIQNVDIYNGLYDI